MKIYFKASQRGKDEYNKHYDRIYELIEKNGYKTVGKSFLHSTGETFYKELEKGGDEAYIKFYNENVQKIKQADITVFECSVPSLSIGFMIKKSLEFNKPTIVLYLDHHIPHFLIGSEEEKLIIKSYSDKNLDEILDESLKEAKQRIDTRFNFFINPDLLNYLNEAAKKASVTKSTFIRNLIIQHRRENKTAR